MLFVTGDLGFDVRFLLAEDPVLHLTVVLIFPSIDGVGLVFVGEKTRRCRESLLARCCFGSHLELLLGEVVWAAVKIGVAGF